MRRADEQKPTFTAPFPTGGGINNYSTEKQAIESVYISAECNVSVTIMLSVHCAALGGMERWVMQSG